MGGTHAAPSDELLQVPHEDVLDDGRDAHVEDPVHSHSPSIQQ